VPATGVGEGLDHQPQGREPCASQKTATARDQRDRGVRGAQCWQQKWDCGSQPMLLVPATGGGKYLAFSKPVHVDGVYVPFASKL